MKWAERILLVFLVVSVTGLTGFLGRNLWMLHEEQRGFADLSERIERRREGRNHVKGTDTGIETGGEGNAEKNLLSDMGEKSKGELNVKRSKEDILPEYQEVYHENPDFAGWVMIEGTKINYPVMQTLECPEYYIHRDFNKKSSYAGTPFIGYGDAACNTDLFLYGHNMRNGTMFADLLKYQVEDYWKGHPIIEFTTLWEHREYEIFTAFHANEEEWTQEEGRLYQVAYGKGTVRANALRALTEASAYDTGITPDPKTPLIYMVTCSYGKKGSRYVVVGMLRTEQCNNTETITSVKENGARVP